MHLTFLACAVLAANPLGEQSFPFYLAPLDPGPSYVDLSALSPEPAGAHGFLTIQNGHFSDPRGQRVRFLGTNVTFAGALPSHEQSELTARRLQRFGFNLVRFHHIDNGTAPRGLWKDPQQTGLDPEMLDRLDYFIAQLKQHGIYVDLNLHVSRSYAGVPFGKLPRTFRYGKVIDHFVPRLIAMQKEFATEYLTHVNPYTQTSYAAEPAVAIIELNNENTLVGAAFNRDLAELPEDLLAPLRDGWRAWVKQHYGDLKTAAKAWQGGTAELGDEILTNGNFAGGNQRWVLESPQPAEANWHVVKGGGPAGADYLSATMTHVGKDSWNFQIHQVGLDLTEGATYTFEFDARANETRRITVGTRVDQADWHATGLSTSVELTPQWQHFRFPFTATRIVPKHTRVSFNCDNLLGTVELANVSLKPGAVVDVGRAKSIAELPVLSGSGGLKAQRRDWVQYLLETELDYVRQLRDHVKQTIGAKGLVVDTQASYGGAAGLLREGMLSDFIDIHSYWQHPSFPGQPWDGNNWNIGNTSMTASAAGGTLSRLSSSRIAGMGYTVSEYDHPFPSFYSAEMFPMIAACAAWQDWDAVMQFCYSSSTEQYAADRQTSYFNLLTHPSKMATAPLAALLIRSGTAKPAAEQTILEVPKDSIAQAVADGGRLWEKAGANPALFAQRRIAVRLVSGDGPPRLVGDPGHDPVDGWLGAQDGTFCWRPEPAEEALFKTETECVAAATGFLGGKTVQVGPLEIKLHPTARNFGVVGLAALDEQPLRQSTKLLLVVSGAVLNSDMGWDETFHTVGKKWGSAPMMAEGLTADLRLQTDQAGLQVQPLDEHGNPHGTVKSERDGGRLSFRIDPSHKTLWYAIRVE